MPTRQHSALQWKAPTDYYVHLSKAPVPMLYISQDREGILYQLVVDCFCSIVKRTSSVKMHTSVLVFRHLLGIYLNLCEEMKFFQRGEIACHKVVWREGPKYSLELQALYIKLQIQTRHISVVSIIVLRCKLGPHRQGLLSSLQIWSPQFMLLVRVML